MRVGKSVLFILALTIMFTASVFPKTDSDKDFAVPAITDFPLLGLQHAGPQSPNQILAEASIGNAAPAELSTERVTEQLRWMDVNRDFQLNDFDIKQFQAIVESLNGEKLTGLELTIRFKNVQKNQRESFPILYDLDRDGMFTPFDVDYFTALINRLDEGSARGIELIQKFRFQVFPQAHKV